MSGVTNVLEAFKYICRRMDGKGVEAAYDKNDINILYVIIAKLYPL